MLVNAKKAKRFVESHDTIFADIIEDRTFVIHFEEVDMDGKVSWASEALPIKKCGLVDLEKIRELLGY